jgi:uncharacterized protein (TIGR03437 family)
MRNRRPLVRFSFWALGFALSANFALARGLSLQAPTSNAQDGFAVVLTDSPEPISALQFDLDYDNPAIKLFPTPGGATRSSNKILVVSDVSPTRQRFVVYGLNGGGIAGGSLSDVAISWRGALGSLQFKIVDAKAVYGNGAVVGLDAPTTNLTLNADTSQTLVPANVWNAASGQSAAVSGGAIMTLRGVGIGSATPMVPANGPIAGSLGGIRVAFDGLSAPLLYAGPDQINVIAPWAITNKDLTQITVSRDSAPIAAVAVPVAETTPEIFTLSSTGTGAGAVINQDGTINTPLTPAPVDSIISIYGTGLGRLTPAGIDGGIAPIAQAAALVSVTIGGVPAEVVYAGSAPTLVSGVFQINCRIPTGITTGPAVEIRVKSGATQSASGVTIAIN